MEFFRQFLCDILSNENVNITITGLDIQQLRPIIQDRCFSAVQYIHMLINDDELDDFACIEKITLLLEEMGCSCNRHDFS